MELDLELEKAVAEIKKNKAKSVLLQLPDGLKPMAEEIIWFLEKNTKAKITIWLGSCYGACDVPNVKGFDAVLQFGHSKWR